MTILKTRRRYSPEVRERAIRMFLQSRQDHSSRWAAIVAVAERIGSTPQTIDNWLKLYEDLSEEPGAESRMPGAKGKAEKIPEGVSPDVGSSDGDRERIRLLEREIRELRKQNALLLNLQSDDTEPAYEEKPDRTENILLIASRSFLRKGYSATSIDEIAEEAGTTGPALYRYFKSKQHILDSICLMGSGQKMAGVQDALDKNFDDPSDTLRLLIANRVEFAFGPWGCQVPICDSEFRHLSEPVQKRVSSDAQINLAEWFRCLSQIRRDVSTRILSALITAVIIEITYAGHHAEEVDFGDGVKSSIPKLAWAGLMA